MGASTIGSDKTMRDMEYMLAAHESNMWKWMEVLQTTSVKHKDDQVPGLDKLAAAIETYTELRYAVQIVRRCRNLDHPEEWVEEFGRDQ